MSTEFTDGERTYHEAVIHGVLDAVVSAGAKEGEAGGMIDFPVAIDALLASIATLAVQSGNYSMPRDARLFAETCGKGLHQMMRGLMAAEAAGQCADWKLEKLGPAN